MPGQERADSLKSVVFAFVLVGVLGLLLFVFACFAIEIPTLVGISYEGGLFLCVGIPFV